MAEKLHNLSASGDVVGVSQLIQTLDVNTPNKRKWTALHFAARFGQKAVVEVLLKGGADKTIKNDEGKTAQDLAQLWGFPEIAELLTPVTTTSSTTIADSAAPPPVAAAPVASINFFAGNQLDRSSNQRKDPEWIKQALAKSDTKGLVLSGSRILLQKGAEQGVLAVIWISSSQLNSLIAKGLTPVLLGLDDASTAYFAVDLNENAELEKEFQTGEEASFQSIRPGAFQIAAMNEAALVAQARSILDWNTRNIYCAMCGQKTTSGDGGYKRTCPNADCKTNVSVQNISHPRLDAVVIGLIVSPDKTKILLGRGKQFPEGFFSCLAGFMEPGETIEEAIRREVVEESNIRVGPVRYHSSQPWPFPSQLMIGCIGQALTEDITIDPEELAECRWFGRAELIEAFKRGFDLRSSLLKMPPKYAIAHTLIRSWVDDLPVSKF